MRSVFPVIICGGGGTRLWPVSTRARPKQFIPLVENATLFDRTVERALSLVAGEGRLIVVAGQAHEGEVRAALGATDAVVILEPRGRDSGPAIAAAAAWVERRDPDGVLVIMPSDHHVPDREAFVEAMRPAVAAAEDGWVVTLGIEPQGPAECYGYIRPEGAVNGPVAQFVEKPDRATAERYIASGFLWNSGMFAARARTLTAQFETHAPGVIAAVRDAIGAVPEGGPLPDAFTAAPAISFDHAVMERTDRAWVVPGSFAWSDLGAWDAVAAADPRPSAARVVGGQNVYVRTDRPLRVTTLGLSNVAVVLQDGDLLVCALDEAQKVRQLDATPFPESPAGGLSDDA